MRMALGVDGAMVLLGQLTSRMTVRELSLLIELAYAYGAEKGRREFPTSIGRDYQ